MADNCCCRHSALCRRNYRTRAHSIGEYNVLKEIGSERAVTSHGKRNPRGVKRKMSNFNLRKRGDPINPPCDPSPRVISI